MHSQTLELYGRAAVRTTLLRLIEALLLDVVEEAPQPAQQLFTARGQRVGTGGRGVGGQMSHQMGGLEGAERFRQGRGARLR